MDPSESAFLRAIGEAPSDGLRRLVYADWLEERNDPRAEFVRLQVQLRELPPGERRTSPLRLREKELRTGLPAYWLAHLDPPVWCVVGNVVSERPFFGTGLFRPNAKIFLADYPGGHTTLDPNLSPSSSIRVVGQHRETRNWIESWVGCPLTTNWRVKLVHHPGALVRLRESGWDGFLLEPDEFECPSERDSGDAIRGLLEALSLVRAGSISEGTGPSG